MELIIINPAQSFQKQERYYNLRRREWKPKIGEKVLERTHELLDKARACNAKLAPKYEGPFKVYRGRSPVIYDTRDEKLKRNVLRVHVRDLKPYRAQESAK